MVAYMKEESFFMCLKWLHHSLTGIIASMMLGESRLDSNESHSLHIFYSFCSKKHILWEEFQGSSANSMFAVTQTKLMALTFISLSRRRCVFVMSDDCIMHIRNDTLLLLRSAAIYVILFL